MKLEFSREGYIRLLLHIEQCGYTILPIKDWDAPITKKLILRHDVDFSLELAADMAELEHRMGVRSTYFVMTFGSFYNPFCSRRALRDIKRRGHEIGLHYFADEPFDVQLNALKALVGEVNAISVHKPLATQAKPVTPLLNVYDRPIEPRFLYVSDSSMKFRVPDILDALETGQDIQLLIHPLWWMGEGEDYESKLLKLSRRKAEAVEKMGLELVVETKLSLERRAQEDV